MTIRHIRLGINRPGRRINDRGGSPGMTFCGEPIGAYDLRVSDLKGSGDGKGWEKIRWYEEHDGCSECLQIVERMGAL
jgi:hypothetical protein